MNKRKATPNAKCWKKESLSERHIACLAGDIHCTTETGPLGLASSSLQLSNTVLIAEWSQLHWLHRRNGLAPRRHTHTHKSKNRKTGCKTLFGSYLWFSSNIKFVWFALVKLMSFLDAFFFKFPSQDLGGNSWGRLLKSKVNLTMWMVIIAVGLKSENVLKCILMATRGTMPLVAISSFVCESVGKWNSPPLICNFCKHFPDKFMVSVVSFRCY